MRGRWVLLAATCGCYGSPTTSPNVSQSTEQIDGGCTAPLHSGGGPGAGCATSYDCGEVCCPCSLDFDAGSFSAAACVDGTCDAPADACALGLQGAPLLCP